jgi:FkbM family methyltransferase
MFLHRSRALLTGVLLGKAALARARSALLGHHVAALLVESRQGRFLVPTDDLEVAGRLAFSGSYETDAVALYEKLFRPTDNILVVGAHVGSLVIPLANVAARVVAVEANPRIFELLRLNVTLNGVTNVELHCLAALDRSGAVEFLDSRINSGGGKVRPLRRRFEFVYDRPRSVSVAAGRLDDVLPAAEPFDVVLLDIEGAEYAAMLGMPRILSQARVMVCELIPNHLDNVSGVTFEKFTEAIPPHFTEFALLAEPDMRVSRDELPALYQRAVTTGYYGGTDLLCLTSA